MDAINGSPLSILQKVWGYSQFRPLQEEIIQAVLSGKDAVALLPTGGGKSICFQVPALAMEGLCLVVSPLIALMKDQVEQLTKKGIKAVAIYSGLSLREIDIALDNCVYGKMKFLYLSPERLQTDIFKERVQKMNISLLAVDEAHCISQWGYDFRPHYLRIDELKNQLPAVKTIALTASADQRVVADIIDKLCLEAPDIFRKSFRRDNLSYSVRITENKAAKLLEILHHVPGSGIVYTSTRKEAKSICQFLLQNKIAADFYHGGLDTKTRSQKQDHWINGRVRVMVATNAFGMGIDKPNVRTVVHVSLPPSLEAYYQEAGRAGRDGRRAYAVLLHHRSDGDALRKRIAQYYPPVDFVKHVYQCLANFYKIAVGSNAGESFDFDLLTFSEAYNMHHLEVYHALSVLDDEGFIELNEGFYRPSKVLINFDHQKLYEFQISHAGFDVLIKGLLRAYGGELFSDFVSIQEHKLASFLKIPAKEVYSGLHALHRLRVVEYEPHKDNPQLSFTTHRWDAKALPIDSKRIEERKSINLSKAEAITRYTEQTRLCRQLVISSYFNETAFQPCGICDVCLEQKKKRTSIDPKEYKQEVLQALGGKNLTADELVEAIKPKEKEEFLEILRIMADRGELIYDKGWGFKRG